MNEIVLAFSLGLLGSAHCVGMCGGFALALSQGAARIGRVHAMQGTYLLGKTLTYAVLGGMAGAFGDLVMQMHGVQVVVSVIAAVALFIIGLSLCGFSLASVRWPGVQKLSGAVVALMQRGTLWATFGLGMLNGLLPCGLVLAMLVQAWATGGVWSGSAYMAAFGLGTLPALYLTSLTGIMARPLWRLRMQRVAGVLLLVMAVLTLVRATPAGSEAMARLMGHLPGEHAYCEVPR